MIMYDFLRFIDSSDIREFNKDTNFTPAEQAVLISLSDKTTVEEKIDALQYLADHYTEAEFQKDSIGDIVKVESLCSPTYYGVISCDWKRPEKTENILMWISLEMYDREKEDFDYTDGSGDCVLGYSFCPYEELPEKERMLKLISDVRKGEMDFYLLLHKFGRKELDELLEWQTR